MFLQIFQNSNSMVWYMVNIIEMIEWLFKAIPYIQPKPTTHPPPTR